jgi:hypothetical protein
VSDKRHSQRYKPEKHEAVRCLNITMKDEVEVVVVGLTIRFANDSQGLD